MVLSCQLIVYIAIRWLFHAISSFRCLVGWVNLRPAGRKLPSLGVYRMGCYFSVNYSIHRAIKGINRFVNGISRLINCIIPMNGKFSATCRTPAASSTSDVYRLLGTYDWFGRSTYGPPAASWPPQAFTDGLGISADWISRSTCSPSVASCPPWTFSDGLALKWPLRYR